MTAEKPTGDDTRDGENGPEDGSQSRTEPVEKKDPKNWNAYAHLANGDVVKVNDKLRGQIATDGNTWRTDGVEHAVIGIYPRENEFTVPEEDDE